MRPRLRRGKADITDHRQEWQKNGKLKAEPDTLIPLFYKKRASSCCLIYFVFCGPETSTLYFAATHLLQPLIRENGFGGDTQTAK